MLLVLTKPRCYGALSGSPSLALLGPLAPAHARPWFRLDMNTLFAQGQ